MSLFGAVYQCKWSHKRLFVHCITSYAHNSLKTKHSAVYFLLLHPALTRSKLNFTLAPLVNGSLWCSHFNWSILSEDDFKKTAQSGICKAEHWWTNKSVIFSSGGVTFLTLTWSKFEQVCALSAFFFSIISIRSFQAFCSNWRPLYVSQQLDLLQTDKLGREKDINT